VQKFLIVNADDLGASSGINRGIVEGHSRGIVTSASLMVTGRAVHEAVAMCRDHPALGIGLHWDVCGEDEREFDLANLAAVRDEFRRQLDAFYQIVGRAPTHVDSHRHVHREEGVQMLFAELMAPLGVPLRGDGRVTYVGGFYAQWEWQVTNLAYVGVPFFNQILRDEVLPGWTELACHPGYRSRDFSSVYLSEREAELRTLTDPIVRRTIDELGIRLVNFAAVPGVPAVADSPRTVASRAPGGTRPYG
jgi:predicted glycoside hydrolase/deacetylase ChbG (UPF0249 family)